MAYYADLARCDYFGRWEDVLVAVGWIDGSHPFAKGPVPREVFAALVRLLRDPWQPVAVAGQQGCPICRFTGGPTVVEFGGVTASVGAANAFIPGDAGVYVAPSLIAHYIDAHEYCPPAEFQKAVLRCPHMRSVAYLKEIEGRGLRSSDGG